MAKKKYYSLVNILKLQAIYNIIIGERSNGKTFAVEDYGLKAFCESGYNDQMAIIRRWNDDFTGKRGQQMFEALVKNGLVAKYTNGEWTNITYYSSRWYLSKYDELLNKTIRMEKPFCYGFSINAGEHDKSTSYPNIKTILFDEFITRDAYLRDEFIGFMNVLSTIIRERDDVRIFMCGNTVNKYCPYFKEMGLTNVEKMKQGAIDVYTYGENTKLKVAVEYCAATKDGKKSDSYFAFNNPKLNMITGGSWEIDIYPHLPHKYKNYNVKYTYFIVFDNHILQCEIIKIKVDGLNHLFTYIHNKTTELKHNKRDRIYSTEYNSSPQYRRYINSPEDDLDKLILSFYKNEKVFYQDNEVGEIVRNYINWCKG